MDTVILGASEVAHLSSVDSETGRIDGPDLLDRKQNIDVDIGIHIRIYVDRVFVREWPLG